jgi:Family of unknown function (DUF6600)
MTAKPIALLAVLAALAGAAGTSYAQPPDYPPPPPPDDQAGAPPPPDAYQDGQPGQYGDPYGDQYGQPLDQYQQYPQPQDDRYPQAPAGGAVDIGFFYNQLGAYGHWIQRGSYGWVWLPFGVRVSWRPYTLGHWVFTEDYGWTWVSTEPFGWATYHYGRWVYDPDYGWEWVPGYDWGPAWVAWRSGAGFIGWAPLPPEVGFRAGFGLDFGGISLDVALRPEHFCFVQERAFLAPNVALYVAPPARNVTIIRSTVNITTAAYRVQSGRVMNQAIPVQHIEQVTGRPVPRLRVAAVSSGAARPEQVRGNQLSVFQPRVVRRATPPPSPQSRARVAGADLQIRHQQEVQDLQQQQAQERSRLQQLHQRELQGGASPRVTPVAPANPPGTNPRDQRSQDQRGQQVEQQRGAREAQPAAPSRQDLAQRHQAEMNALQQQHQREQQQLAARHRLEQQTAQRQPPPQQRPPAQPRRNEPPPRRPENPPPPR